MIGGCLPAQCVIEDLASLRVTNEHERSARALLVESVHCGDDGIHALLDGVRIADTSTRRLASTCGIANRLRGRARVGPCDQVDNGARRAKARRHSCLAGTKDVDARAGLALLDLGDGVSGGEKCLGCCEDEGVGLHCNESGIEKRVERADKVLEDRVFRRCV